MRIHDAGHNRDDERRKGDQIIANAPPDKEGEHDAQQTEKKDLLIGHACSPACGHSIVEWPF
ncbi:hypothetical protein [Nitratireductor aquibiodomus]